MATEKQIRANQRNARRSTGPRNTDKTRLNAMKHGLLAAGLTELDRRDAPELLAQLVEYHEPVGPSETLLIEYMACLWVRIQRAVKLERVFVVRRLDQHQYMHRVLDAARKEADDDDGEDEDDGGGGLAEVPAGATGGGTEPDAGNSTAVAGGSGAAPGSVGSEEEEDEPEDFAYARRLDENDIEVLSRTVGRYETTLLNRLFQVSHELERQQRPRRGERVPAPVVGDLTIHTDAEPCTAGGATGAAGASSACELGGETFTQASPALPANGVSVARAPWR